MVLFFLFALLLTTFQNNQGAAVFFFSVNISYLFKYIFLIFTSCLLTESFPGSPSLIHTNFGGLPYLGVVVIFNSRQLYALFLVLPYLGIRLGEDFF